MRLQGTLARAGAKNAKAEQESQKQAEEEARARQEYTEIDRRAKEVRERRDAERLAREEAIVYLRGGYHKIGGNPPDETDTPLDLTADHTVRGA